MTINYQPLQHIESANMKYLYAQIGSVAKLNL